MNWDDRIFIFFSNQAGNTGQYKKAMHDANKHMQHFWSLSEIMSDFKSLDRLIKAISEIKNGKISQFQESQKPTLRSPGRKDWVLVYLTFLDGLFSTKIFSDKCKLPSSAVRRTIDCRLEKSQWQNGKPLEKIVKLSCHKE